MVLVGQVFNLSLLFLPDPRPNGFKNVQDMTGDGKHVGMYWKDSERATIYIQGKERWSHLNLNSFWRVLNDNVFEYQFASLENGRVRVDLKTGSMVFDPRGLMLELEAPGRRRCYQCAFKDFNGVPFPRATLDVRYRDGNVYSLDLLVVRNAQFNRPLEETFQLSVPARTVIIDARKVDTENSPRLQVKVPVQDAVAWLLQRSPK